MNDPVKLMLVEDHVGYRSMLIRALKQAINPVSIADYSTAEVALRELERTKPQEMPDVVLLDLNLPGMSGFESIQWFKKYSDTLKIVILTQSNVEEDILSAMSQGASGYLLKSATITQITDAIQSVIAGGASIDPKMANYILKQLDQSTFIKSPLERPLSDRELQILALLAQGKARKEICEELKITINTVSYHVVHIYEKLGVLNAPAAIDAAYRKGVLPIESPPSS